MEHQHTGGAQRDHVSDSRSEQTVSVMEKEKKKMDMKDVTKKC